MQLNLSTTFISQASDAFLALHSHESFEIALCLSGQGRILINDRTYTVESGNLILIGGKVSHQYVLWGGKIEHCQIHVPYETLWTLSDEGTNLIKIFEAAGPVIELSPSESEELQRHISNLGAVHNPTGVILEKNIHICEIILFILRLCNKDNAYDEVSPQTSLEKIVPALNYIHGHYKETILLDDICNEIFVSKFYLCRLFKEATGITIQQYISSYRIRQSCLFLQNGSSVQAAGEAVGFEDNSSYIRSFKRVMGLTPGQYIKLHT